jgi:hypothetical protein
MKAEKWTNTSVPVDSVGAWISRFDWRRATSGLAVLAALAIGVVGAPSAKAQSLSLCTVQGTVGVPFSVDLV